MTSYVRAVQFKGLLRVCLPMASVAAQHCAQCTSLPPSEEVGVINQCMYTRHACYHCGGLGTLFPGILSGTPILEYVCVYRSVSSFCTTSRGMGMVLMSASAAVAPAPESAAVSAGCCSSPEASAAATAEGDRATGSGLR